MAYFTFVLLVVSLLAASNAAPQNTNSGITIPEECSGNGFCSIRPKGYDEIEAKINELLPAHLIEIGSRQGFAPNVPETEHDDNCPSELTWRSVYTYRDSSSTDVDIIVQTKLFPQQLVTRTCKHSAEGNKRVKEGSPQCFRKLGLSDFNFKSSCQESRATRTLLVYDPQVKQLKMKSYSIPCCCSCQIWKNL